MIDPHVTFQDSRVHLVPLEESHFEDLRTYSQNEATLWQYSLMQPTSDEDLKKYIAVAIKQRESGLALPFLVYDKLTSQAAGSTRFYDISFHHKVASIGYTWYGKSFWGTGLNKHCKYLLLNYAFTEWDCKRVEFRADANNERSIAAMKSIGCTEEGILRSNCKSLDGRRDSIVLSILQDEWFDVLKDKLATRLT